ncbi:hypothetical protein BDQ94DRAFT_162898 [Aspergillus welwitschiae]|uniref:Uncharacterized protein n=1 Tax=Aspergillus welwitschiae TaxID=1341132 RepID=A0A3F3PN81_9EURO|nr:hypothetical protein BDQ94DRAFT_162898 [Aspergillus welwitschiae]RDH28369.1 hypothetical protein BDQ94DRAFT_162898 [Aspergillus welwitschiae]
MFVNVYPVLSREYDKVDPSRQGVQLGRRWENSIDSLGEALNRFTSCIGYWDTMDHRNTVVKLYWKFGGVDLPERSYWDHRVKSQVSAVAKIISAPTRKPSSTPRHTLPCRVAASPGLVIRSSQGIATLEAQYFRSARPSLLRRTFAIPGTAKGRYRWRCSLAWDEITICVTIGRHAWGTAASASTNAHPAMDHGLEKYPHNEDYTNFHLTASVSKRDERITSFVGHRPEQSGERELSVKFWHQLHRPTKIKLVALSKPIPANRAVQCQEYAQECSVIHPSSEVADDGLPQTPTPAFRLLTGSWLHDRPLGYQLK